MSRKKIFEEWDEGNQRQQINTMQKKKKDKDKQSCRAEQSLEKSLLILTNIDSIKQMKMKYKDQQQLCQVKIANINKTLEEISKEDSNNRNTFKNIEKSLYKEIRNNQSLLYQLKAFSLTNLPNYDKSNSKVCLTRTKQQAQSDLLFVEEKIKKQRLKLQESLVMYQYNIKPSSVLGQTQTFDYCLSEIEQLMKEQSIIDIHSLMMYQLQDLEEIISKQQLIVKDLKLQYQQYEAIYDSIILMQSHTQKMKNDSKYFNKFFQDLNVESSNKIIPQGRDSLKLLEKNLLIYQSNKENFVRFGAETDMRNFHRLRKLYTNELNSYQKSFKIWKDKLQVSNYIYIRQLQLHNFQQKAKLGSLKAVSNLDKQNIMHAYYQCLEKEIPTQMDEIKIYKYSLCQKMQKQINNSGISIPIRTQSILSSKKDNFRKYIQFFNALEYKPDKKKPTYFYESRNLIEVFLYEINQQQLKNNEQFHQIEKYRVGLSYAQKIAQIESNLQSQQKQLEQINIAKKIKQFENIKVQRWQSLPIGLDNILFNYINNLSLIKNREHLFKQNKNNCKKFEDQLIRILMENPDNNIQGDSTQTPYQCFQMNLQIYQEIYGQIINKMSFHTPLLSFQCQKQYWDQWVISTKFSYDKYFKNVENLNMANITKKQFFSFKVLCYLLVSKKLKIPNPGDLCAYLIQYIDRGYTQWSNNQKFLQIIKIQLFKEYLESVLITFTQTTFYIEICQNLLEFLRLLFNCQIFIQSVQNNLENCYYGTKLYIKLSEYTVKFSSTQKIQLQQKLKYMIKTLKSYPIVIGTKEGHNSFILFSKQNKLLMNINHQKKIRDRQLKSNSFHRYTQ